MRLANNVPWTILIVLDVGERFLRDVSEGDEVALTYKGEPVAVMEVEEIYTYEKREFEGKVYGTLSEEHLGVVRTMNMEDRLIEVG